MSVAEKIAKTSSQIRAVHKIIKVKKQSPAAADLIAKEFGMSAVASRVLAARGYEVGPRLKHYLSPTLKEGMPEPGGLKGLKAACDLIKSVTEGGGGIAICCDFDVDGLSGGSQALHFLRAAGVNSKVFVPDRFEDGYGLNDKMVQQIADEGFKLLLTIDYGTTNTKELTFARKLGLKAIVLDHHHVGGSPPPCDAFINPNQKGCGFADKVLCASGLTWYLLLGLRQTLPSAKSLDVKSYLDLACLGTICDMVPLIGANRVVAKRGLEILSNSERPGLKALKDVIGVRNQVSCFDVSFGIGPRLNAAGRMVHGDVVIELLTTADSIAAKRIAKKLNDLNLQRQETEAEVKEIAVKNIESRGELPSGLVVWDESFHTGVIGIVAQRLVEMFYRPAVVLGADKDGVFKGSVRGVKGFNVVEALAATSEHLIKYGGHEGAGGLSVHQDNLEAFEAAFIEQCLERLSDSPKGPVAEADTIADIPELSLDLVQELKGFSPFGVGNPGPLLFSKGVKVTEVKSLKGAHLKAMFTDGKKYLQGILWRQAEHPALKQGNSVNIVYRIDSNAFNGTVSLQANIEAIELNEK